MLEDPILLNNPFQNNPFQNNPFQNNPFQNNPFQNDQKNKKQVSKYHEISNINSSQNAQEQYFPRLGEISNIIPQDTIFQNQDLLGLNEKKAGCGPNYEPRHYQLYPKKCCPPESIYNSSETPQYGKVIDGLLKEESLLISDPNHDTIFEEQNNQLYNKYEEKINKQCPSPHAIAITTEKLPSTFKIDKSIESIIGKFKESLKSFYLQTEEDAKKTIKNAAHIAITALRQLPQIDPKEIATIQYCINIINDIKKDLFLMQQMQLDPFSKLLNIITKTKQFLEQKEPTYLIGRFFYEIGNWIFINLLGRPNHDTIKLLAQTVETAVANFIGRIGEGGYTSEEVNQNFESLHALLDRAIAEFSLAMSPAIKDRELLQLVGILMDQRKFVISAYQDSLRGKNSEEKYNDIIQYSYGLKSTSTQSKPIPYIKKQCNLIGINPDLINTYFSNYNDSIKMFELEEIFRRIEEDAKANSENLDLNKFKDAMFKIIYGDIQQNVINSTKKDRQEFIFEKQCTEWLKYEKSLMLLSENKAYDLYSIYAKDLWNNFSIELKYIYDKATKLIYNNPANKDLIISLFNQKMEQLLKEFERNLEKAKEIAESNSLPLETESRIKSYKKFFKAFMQLSEDKQAKIAGMAGFDINLLLSPEKYEKKLKDSQNDQKKKSVNEFCKLQIANFKKITDALNFDSFIINQQKDLFTKIKELHDEQEKQKFGKNLKLRELELKIQEKENQRLLLEQEKLLGMNNFHNCVNNKNNNPKNN